MEVLKLNTNINNIKIFSNLDDCTLKKIYQASDLKKFKKNDLLFAEKEKLKYIYLLVEGVVALYKPNKTDNGKKVLFILGPGEILNELIFDNEPTPLSCEFLTNGKILRVPKTFLNELMKNNFTLCTSIITSLISRQKRMIHQMKTSSPSITVDRQLAFKLWKLAKDFGKSTNEGTEINFDLSITYLAEILGNKRETISRQVKVLVNNSLINLHKKRFIIKDSEKLLEYFKTENKN